jgi:hypothetical protein
MVQVRGVEQEDVPWPTAGGDVEAALQRACRLPPGFAELPETGMSELGRLCQQAGLDSLFRTALKL